MLQLTEQEVRTLEEALNALYGHLQDNCWPPKDLSVDEKALLKRSTDALLDKYVVDSFDPQI